MKKKSAFPTIRRGRPPGQSNYRTELARLRCKLGLSQSQAAEAASKPLGACSLSLFVAMEQGRRGRGVPVELLEHFRAMEQGRE